MLPPSTIIPDGLVSGESGHCPEDMSDFSQTEEGSRLVSHSLAVAQWLERLRTAPDFQVCLMDWSRFDARRGAA